MRPNYLDFVRISNCLEPSKIIYPIEYQHYFEQRYQIILNKSVK